MEANKVTLNGKVLIDLTRDTVTEESVVRGSVFHKADGTITTGTAILGKIIEVATVAEMDALLAEATEMDVGTCYKYVGNTNSIYKTDALYVITETD